MNGFFWFLTGGILAAGIFFSWNLYRSRQQHKRLQHLTAYLETAGSGQEVALTPTEDEFSLLEDEIYKTVGELRIAREKEGLARQRQADNLADIAHQLKTPLTSMSLMTQLLSEEASTEQQEYIGRLDSQLTRLNWLTSSLLTLSRLDAGTVKFTPAALTFEELAVRAAEPLEQLLQERDQPLHIHGKELSLSCDPYWTAEALMNLIKNCSEHTPAKGQITLTANSTPLYLQITVEDTGAGFDPNDLPHLFSRFFRGSDSSKESVGIGLALCRAVIEGQGGIIRAENRPKGGARFLLRFYP